MARKEKIVCQCGGELRRPIPKKCPHCGAQITAIKRRGLPSFLPVVIVILMFAAMLAYLYWLVSGP